MVVCILLSTSVFLVRDYTAEGLISKERSQTNFFYLDNFFFYPQRKGNLPSEEDEHHPLQPEDGEVQVEEKTIRAVHTQTKVQTLCYNCLYDVSSSAEVSTDFISAGGSLKMAAKV